MSGCGDLAAPIEDPTEAELVLEAGKILRRGDLERAGDLRRHEHNLTRIRQLGPPIQPHPIRIHDECRWCGEASQFAVLAIVNRKGQRFAKAYCAVCGHNYGGQLPRSLVDPTDLPLMHDNACLMCRGGGCSECAPSACDVCESYENVQEHHWALRCDSDRFRDWQAWPTAWLCQECHSEWHKITTPTISSRGRAA